MLKDFIKGQMRPDIIFLILLDFEVFMKCAFSLIVEDFSKILHRFFHVVL